MSEERGDSPERLALAGAVSASLAHELRNLLAVMESSIFLARRQLESPERADRHLSIVVDNIRKAHALTGSVLALARGDAVCRDPLIVGDLIEDALAEVAVSGTPGVTFERDVEPTDLTVMAEPLLLSRVLVNLYANAVGALRGTAAGVVTTHVRRDQDVVIFRVIDNGPGIPASLVSRLFEPLASERQGGTGLGLALCRAVVRAHQGDIKAVTRSNGAELMFWLPVELA